MFDKILVGADGSLASKTALAKAVDIARVSECEITILNVTLTLESFWGYSPYGESIDDDKLIELGYKVIEDTLEGIDVEGIKLTKKVRLGAPELEIVDEGVSGCYDLIALGSRGIKLLAGTFLGTVSERVLKTAMCPVLIVKDPETVKKLRIHHLGE